MCVDKEATAASWREEEEGGVEKAGEAKISRGLKALTRRMAKILLKIFCKLRKRQRRGSRLW